MKASPITLVFGAPRCGKSTLVATRLAEDALLPSAWIGAAPGPAQPGKWSTCRLEYDGDVDAWAEQVLIELGRRAQQSDLKSLVWEVSPGVEPLYAVDLFEPDGEQPGLHGVAEVNSIVTVLDASTLLADLACDEPLAEWEDNTPITDPASSVAELLVEQIEVADTLVLHRLDNVGEAVAGQLHALLAAMNPRARQLGGSRGQLPDKQVLFSGGYREGEGNEYSAWVDLPRPADGTPDAHQVACLRFTADRPFHPERLWNVMYHHWEGVLRSKGLLWTASRPRKAGWWSQVADLMTVDWVPWRPEGLTHREWGRMNLPYSLSEAEWRRGIGPPRQELALIGLGVDLRSTSTLLSEAILTEKEWQEGERVWRRYPDPFASVPRPGA